MTTPSHNTQIVLDAYAAMTAGDIKAFLAVLDPEIVVSEPTPLPHGGVYRGVAELMGMFAKAAPVLDSSQMVVEETTAEGDRVVATLHAPIRGSDAQATISEHWRLEDGKVIELTVFWADPTLVEAHA